MGHWDSITIFENLPFHDRFCSSVTVQASKFALSLNSCSNTVGEVLPAVRDNVPGHTVLGGECTRTRAQPAKSCQVRAQPEVQGDGAAVYPQVCIGLCVFFTAVLVSQFDSWASLLHNI